MAEPAAASSCSVDYCFEGLKHAGCCVKLMCTCTCCIGLIGPIILIVGIVMIALPNSRASDVKEFNDAIKAYDATPLANMDVPGSNIQGARATLQSSHISVKGNLEDVNTAGYSSYLQSAANFVAGSTITFDIDDVDTFQRNPKKVSEARVDMECSSSSGCMASTMRNRCSELGGTYLGSGCSSDSSACGTCTYPTFLDTYCAVITPKHNQSPVVRYAADTTYQSCYYPFTTDSQLYSTANAATVNFQVRLQSDPFIVLQRVTEGKEDFGITATQQRVAGLALLIVGAVVIVFVVVAAYVVYRLIKSAMEAKNLQQQRRVPAVGIPMSQVPPAPGSVVPPALGYGNQVSPATPYQNNNSPSVLGSGVFDDKPPGYGDGPLSPNNAAYHGYSTPQQVLPYDGLQSHQLHLGAQNSVSPVRQNANGDYEV